MRLGLDACLLVLFLLRVAQGVRKRRYDVLGEEIGAGGLESRVSLEDIVDGQKLGACHARHEDDLPQIVDRTPSINHF